MATRDPHHQIVLNAIKTAQARHSVRVNNLETWKYQWICSCREKSRVTDVGTATYEGAEHQRNMMADAVLEVLSDLLNRA